MAPQDRLSATLDRPAAPAGTPVPSTEAGPLVSVRGLSVAYDRRTVVDDVSFDLPRWGSLALIGESGSGKSTIARAILRLLPDTGRATGEIRFGGDNLLALSERRFRSLRGRRLGFVPQDPGNSLNPVRTIGSQAREAARLVDGLDRAAADELILDTFARVGLDDPRRAYESYPHQLSGGMLQRVLIGLAALPGPDLLIADEPTSALDVTIQKRILDLLSELRETLGIGLLLITHDLAIAAERADLLVVLRGGRVQETGDTRSVFGAPTSEYARKLHADVPSLNPDRYAGSRAAGLVRLTDPATEPRIDVRSVTKSFTVDGSRLTAVDNVSFSVPTGTTHALVGESGSGKTTTIRLLLGLEQPDSGEIVVAGERLDGRSHRSLRTARRNLALVYQNPYTSLDPTWRVDRLICEPLDRYRVGTPAERTAQVARALEAVGLDDTYARRRPARLSGGQRQRVAIARALVLRPGVIVLDEPTSALDVSVQADIVGVLLRLQAELGLTYVFVSHDLALVRQLAHSVTVMRRGRVVESGPVDDVLEDPAEDYTRTLVESVPAGLAGRSA